MLKLCPAVVAILDFQSTANKNRQYLTQTFDLRPRPLNCHREKKRIAIVLLIRDVESCPLQGAWHSP